VTDDAGRRLPGAGTGRQIFLVGNTVRRPPSASSAAVRLLLDFLEAEGFGYSPRYLGTDADGRDVLSYIPGVDGRSVAVTDDLLASAAEVLRAYHETVRGLPVRLDIPVAEFGSPAAAVVCHNDFAPYNTIFDQGRLRGVIDWDQISYAPPIWDVVNAAWSFVPLYTDADCQTLGLGYKFRGRRLARFCAAYGGLAADEVLPALDARLRSMPSPYAQRSRELLRARWTEWNFQLHLSLD